MFASAFRESACAKCGPTNRESEKFDSRSHPVSLALLNSAFGAKGKIDGQIDGRDRGEAAASVPLLPSRSVWKLERLSRERTRSYPISNRLGEASSNSRI